MFAFLLKKDMENNGKRFTIKKVAQYLKMNEGLGMYEYGNTSNPLPPPPPLINSGKAVGNRTAKE